MEPLGHAAQHTTTFAPLAIPQLGAVVKCREAGPGKRDKGVSALSRKPGVDEGRQDWQLKRVSVPFSERGAFLVKTKQNQTPPGKIFTQPSLFLDRPLLASSIYILDLSLEDTPAISRSTTPQRLSGSWLMASASTRWRCLLYPSSSSFIIGFQIPGILWIIFIFIDGAKKTRSHKCQNNSDGYQLLQRNFLYYYYYYSYYMNLNSKVNWQGTYYHLGLYLRK